MLKKGDGLDSRNLAFFKPSADRRLPQPYERKKTSPGQSYRFCHPDDGEHAVSQPIPADYRCACDLCSHDFCVRDGA